MEVGCVCLQDQHALATLVSYIHTQAEKAVQHYPRKDLQAMAKRIVEGQRHSTAYILRTAFLLCLNRLIISATVQHTFGVGTIYHYYRLLSYIYRR